MKRTIAWFSEKILPVLVLTGAIFCVAATGVEYATTFYHSGSLGVTAVSQRVETSRMRNSSCTGWTFRNRSETVTFYLNVNVALGYNGPAQVTDTNMVVVGPGEVYEFYDSLIKRFSVIGSGATGGTEDGLYWLCGCK